MDSVIGKTKPENGQIEATCSFKMYIEENGLLRYFVARSRQWYESKYKVTSNEVDYVYYTIENLPITGNGNPLVGVIQDMESFYKRCKGEYQNFKLVFQVLEKPGKV